MLDHSCIFLDRSGLAPRYWAAIDSSLVTVRMPTFFLLSGLFARRSLGLGYREFALRKVLNFGYLYAAWAAIFALVLAGTDALRGKSTIGAHWHDALTLSNNIWYLAALGVFFLLARILRAVPWVIQIAAAGTLSLVFTLDLVVLDSWGLDHMAQYFVFFLAGCYLKARIIAFTEAGTWVRLAIFGALWFLTTLVTFLFVPEFRPVGTALIPAVSVPFALTAALLISSHRHPGRL